MTRRRKFLWFACGLAALVAAAVGPFICQFARGQRFFLARPTPYWANECYRWAITEGTWSPHWQDRLLHTVGFTVDIQQPAVLSSRDAAVEAVIRQLLHDLRPEVRRIAVEHLMTRGERSKEFIPTLIEMLDCKLAREDRSYRTWVVEELGGFGPAAVAATPALQGLLNDHEAPVREAATGALKRVTPQ